MSKLRKSRRASLLASALERSPPDFLGDGQRFARQHRRLIRDADRAADARSGSKPGDTARANVDINASRRQPPFDEVADEPRLVHVAHDEVVAFGILPHLRRRRARLLVVVLAVNQRREAVARVASRRASRR